MPQERSVPSKIEETIYLLRPIIGGLISLIGVIMVAFVLSWIKDWFSSITELEWIAALIIVVGYNISNQLDDFFDPDARRLRRKYAEWRSKGG